MRYVSSRDRAACDTETLDWSNKREVIRALVKRAEIGKEDVRIVYKVGQLPFVQGPASGASWQDCTWSVFVAIATAGSESSIVGQAVTTRKSLYPANPTRQGGGGKVCYAWHRYSGANQLH